ncbi:unnamed protein product (mitochondrion) [Plasmodiophora brassicae]|uniref:Amino acid permease/ SLC12A domain-containing protein n=2 Tax=Plasmodiophora brassicae TaxID=37360 RepID=A0A3P3Y8U4_PLABS|nr:unnamed protein product [Plasmodiophora brassicae]
MPSPIRGSLRRRLLYDDRKADERPGPASVPYWQWPGWGRSSTLTVADISVPHDRRPAQHVKLGQVMATAISGNDITSSCLYSAGQTIAVSGAVAPLSLLLVSVMLYLFRSIYSEVVLALPSNGGVYNCLLNTTSKQVASLAACLTILSYVATATVSANTACQYLATVFPQLSVPVMTQLLLLVFAFITLCGLRDSAIVAQCIFVVHLGTLASLIGIAIVSMFVGGDLQLQHNWDTSEIGLWQLVSGFAAASLGISGFETSANFIEEQADGVFPLTLRNMWMASSVINPALCLIGLTLLPMETMVRSKGALLSKIAEAAGGPSFGNGLKIWVALDAFVVLSGSLLTAFVGVTGLCKRMAFDRCLPNFFLQENSWRKTNHWIIIGFLLVCSSMQFLLHDVSVLAGVYSISFLSVMALFAIGDSLIKFKRDSIKRPIRAGWLTIAIALAMVSVALCSTVVDNLSTFRFFLFYFFITIAFVLFMFYRLILLRIVLYFSAKALSPFPGLKAQLHDVLTRAMQRIASHAVLFYTPNDHLPVMNKAILYIRENEQASWIRIAYLCKDPSEVPSDFVSNVALLDSIYPKVRIDSLVVVGEMSQETCDAIAYELHIPVNMQLICCPEEGVSHLPTVRIITRYIVTEEQEAVHADQEARQKDESGPAASVSVDVAPSVPDDSEQLCTFPIHP